LAGQRERNRLLLDGKRLVDATSGERIGDGAVNRVFANDGNVRPRGERGEAVIFFG
jgi:hypothetical protein